MRTAERKRTRECAKGRKKKAAHGGVKAGEVGAPDRTQGEKIMSASGRRREEILSGSMRSEEQHRKGDGEEDEIVTQVQIVIRLRALEKGGWLLQPHNTHTKPVSVITVHLFGPT